MDGGNPARLAVVTSLVGLTLIAGVRLVPAVRDLVDARRADARIPAAHLATAGAPVSPLFTAYTEWLRRVVPPRDRYWVASSAIHAGDPYFQWLSFRLEPRRPTEVADEADVAIAVSRDRASAPPGFGPLRTFAPGLGLAFRER
jgi:hypothetical protein